MYVKRNYSLKDMVSWTRQETALLALIALVPVIVYEVFDQKWLHLPWLPIAVVGTAAAVAEVDSYSGPNERTSASIRRRRVDCCAAPSTGASSWRRFAGLCRSNASVLPAASSASRTSSGTGT